jgi:predicted acetyltransferase
MEVEIGRITVRGQPGKKAIKTTFQSISRVWVVVHICHPNYAGGIIRRIAD